GDVAGGREVPGVGEELAAAVEGPGEGGGPAGHLGLQRLGLAPQPPSPLRPPGVLLPVRAGVAGMSPQPLAQPRQLRVVHGGGAGPAGCSAGTAWRRRPADGGRRRAPPPPPVTPRPAGAVV